MRRPCLPGHAVARDLSRQSGVLVWHGETSRGYLALAGNELLTAATPEEMWMRLAARGLIPTREESSPRSMVLPGRDHLADADTTNTTWTQTRPVRPARPAPMAPLRPVTTAAFGEQRMPPLSPPAALERHGDPARG